MLKKFFSSLFLLVILNLIIKPLWIFGIDRQVQNQIGTEEFGNYFAIFNLAFIFNFLVDVGLSTYYNQKIAAGKIDPSQTFAPVSFLKIFLGLIYAVLLLVIALISGLSDIKLLLLVALNQFLFSMLIFLRAAITAMQMYKVDSVFSVLDKIIMITIAGLYIYFPEVAGNITLYKFVLIQAFAVFISIIIAFIIIAMKHKLVLSFAMDFRLLKESIPFAVVILFMSAHSRQDGFLLERMHKDGDLEAGYYAAGFRILDACNMIGVLFSGFLLPFISKNFSNRSLISRTIKISSALLISFAFGVILVSWFYRTEIHDLLYKDHNAYASDLLAYTLMALPGYFLVHIFGTYLTASGSVQKFVTICFFCMIINLSLNLIFIPRFGAQGSALIAIGTQTLFGLLLLYRVNKELSLIRT